MGHLDFSISGADEGYNEADSIQRYDNGELANQSVFRRPPENLRTRTEEIRAHLDLLEMVVASDRGLVIMGDPDMEVTWDGTAGTIAIPALSAFQVIPIKSTAATGVTAPGNPIRCLYYYNDGAGNEFQVMANSALHTYNGANNLFFEIFDDGNTLVTPVVTAEGDGGSGTYPQDGPVTIRVEITTGTHTLNDVITALQGVGAPISNYISTNPAETMVTLGGGAANVTTVTRRRFYTDAGGAGAVEPEGIEITNAMLTTLPALAEGDTVVVNFDSATDRMAIDTSVAVGVGTGYPELQVLSVDSRYAAEQHTVPLCKVYNGRLHFLNGRTFESNIPGKLIQSDTYSNDGTGVTVAGDTKIGADDKTDDDHTLARSDVATQLTDILGRLYLTVDAGGDGDFTTVDAALSALAAATTTGGTIYVKKGSYAENITLGTDFDHSVNIIGEARETVGGGVDVRFVQSGAAPFIESTNDFSGTLSFENILFTQNAADSIMEFTGETDEATRGGVVLKNCHVVADGAYTEPMIISSVDFAAQNTQFDGNSYTNDNQVAKHYRKSGATKKAKFSYVDCGFYDFRKLLYLGDTGGEDDLGQFVFSHNQIVNCGYTSGFAVTETLIESETSGLKTVQVCVENNLWDDTTSASNGATFCTLQGSGSIGHNQLLCGAKATLTGAPPAIIYGKGLNGKLKIDNNEVHLFYGMGLELAGNVSAYNNALLDYTPNHANAYAIYLYGENNVAEKNVVTVGTVGAAPDAVIFSTATSSKIHGNRIGEITFAGNGIELSAPSQVSVSRNQLDYDTGAVVTSSCGISTDAGSFVEITDNIIGTAFGRPQRGIYVGSSMAAVRVLRNQIQVGSTAATVWGETTGIHITGSYDHQASVSDNLVDVSNTAGDDAIGILLDCDRVMCNSNGIKVSQTGTGNGRGILVRDSTGTTGDDNAITGNHVYCDDDFAIVFDGTAAYNLCIGNYAKKKTGATGIGNHIDDNGTANGGGAAGATLTYNWTP